VAEVVGMRGTEGEVNEEVVEGDVRGGRNRRRQIAAGSRETRRLGEMVYGYGRS